MTQLSCGHKIDDLDDSNTIAIKAWEITENGWVKAIHYLSVCKDCEKDYRKEDAILDNEHEESQWIDHKV